MEIKLWTEEEVREATNQVFRDNGYKEHLPTIIYTHSRNSWADVRRNRIKHPYWMLTGIYCTNGEEIDLTKEDVYRSLLIPEYSFHVIVHEACHCIHYLTDPKDQGKHGHGKLFKEIESRELSRYDLAAKYSRAYPHTLYRQSDGVIVWARDEKLIGGVVPEKAGKMVQGYLFDLSRKACQ